MTWVQATKKNQTCDDAGNRKMFGRSEDEVDGKTMTRLGAQMICF